MSVISLTVHQRLNLEGIIRQQRSPDDETLMSNFELIGKIRIPREERSLYLREFNTPQGTQTEFFFNMIRAAAPIEIDLTAAEIRRLDTLLREWKSYSTDDVEWLLELKHQLAAIQNGVVTGISKKKKEAVG